MTPRPLLFALTAALALPLSAQAVKYTYHGDLMDGDAPASGAYDLRVRSFAQPGATKTLGEATELPGVALVEGRFSIELDLPEDGDGTTWVEVAVRKSDSGEGYVALGDPQPLTKVNSTCPGAWALDGNSGAPVGSYLGFADARPVFINSPSGVAMNSLLPPGANIDLSLNPKATGDADTDLQWTSRSGKDAGIYLRDDTGNLVQYATSGAFEFYDGVPTATQNNGLETFAFSGRLRLRAAGVGATDTSGGIWFDDERGRASFVGRGDNASNWTGIFEGGGGGWRFTSHDNGAFGFNTGTEALAANVFKVNSQRFLVNTDAYVPTPQEQLVVGNGGVGQYTTLTLLEERGLGQIYRGFFSLNTDYFGNPNNDGAELYIAASGPGLPSSHTIFPGSRVGIARRTAVNALEVEGNASKTTATAWLANSDRRIKTEIAPIPNALDTIMKLRPVTFQYGDAYRKEHDSIGGEHYYNVIAQDFAEVLPDAVKGSGEYLPGKPKSKENEILQVDTYPAQITSIAAIQELAVQDDALQDEVTTLKHRNAALSEQLDELMHRMARLESRQER